jgi:hypothetical protein
MYRGTLTPRKAAVLALNLPRGAGTWQAVGGAGAISGEVEASWMLEHTMQMIAHGQGGGKGKAPQMRDYPAGLHEEQAKAAKSLSRAERFRQKHLQK